MRDVEAVDNEEHILMRGLTQAFMVAAALACLAHSAAAQGAKPLKKCPPDAVVAGTVCMDKYEASVWLVPDPFGANKALVKKIQSGKVTDATTLTAAGAVQLGVGSDDYGLCLDAGQNCGDDLYAVSIPGVTPSAHATWFQAVRACENSRKRLPSNAEWQAAVIGTPDPGPDNGTTDCNTASTGTAAATGSRTSCVSVRGVHDMVGNLDEWVADWVPKSSLCAAWPVGVSPTGDYQCLAGTFDAGAPGALMRGGHFLSGAEAGPLAVRGVHPPSSYLENVGFRCAR